MYFSSNFLVLSKFKKNNYELDKKYYYHCSISSFFFSVSFSQCDYSINEVDEFTKKEKKQTYSKLIREFTGSNANILFDKQGVNYWLTLNYNVQYAKAMVVGHKDLLFLKLENDSVVTFAPENIVSGDMRTINRITTTQIIITYKLNKEDLQFLSLHKIVSVRVNFTDGYRDHSVKPKFHKTIKKAIECILK